MGGTSVALIAAMRVRTAAQFLTIALMSACGRTENDEGSSGGAPSFGGVVGQGGSGAFGSGGRLVSGGAPGQGGAPGSGGRTIQAGGSAQGGSGHGGSAHGGEFPGGSAGAGGADDGILVESSWDTALAVSVTRPTGSVPLTCTKGAFTMHLTPNAADLGVIWGADGVVLKGILNQQSFGGPHYVYVKDLTIPTNGGDCGVSSASVKSLRLDGEDLDGDGVVDHVTGSGTAIASVLRGDVVESVEISLTLNAKPDRTRPTLVVPQMVHPLDGAFVRSSEPLGLATMLTLNNGSSVVTLKESSRDAGALGAFSAPNILPFQSTWALKGSAADLAGFDVDFASVAALQTLPDPGLFAQDGFESAPKMTTAGEVKLVGQIGSLPAIAGTQSLLVTPNSSATFHLQRPSGANAVRLSLQRLMSVNYTPGGSTPVVAGVIGGVTHVSAASSAPTGTPTATGDATWAYAAAKEELELDLTESGSEVVVRVAPYGCNGLCPPPQALLIDDLRVE